MKIEASFIIIKILTLTGSLFHQKIKKKKQTKKNGKKKKKVSKKNNFELNNSSKE